MENNVGNVDSYITDDANLVHVVSAKNSNSLSGIANLSCSGDFPGDYQCNRTVICGINPFGVFETLMFYNTYPTYSWTVNVIAHELGHNFGSPHTHSCAWNTNFTAIDGFRPSESFLVYRYNSSTGLYEPEFETCSRPSPNCPAAGGTIMSYCYQNLYGSIVFANGFGTVVGNHIRAQYADKGCLTGCSSSCSDGLLSGDEEGVNCGGLNPNCPDCISGCTDIAACNYDPSANVNTGCEYLSCAGCTNAGACNYDNSATIDDGSCEYTSCAGCTEVFASNYDPTKTINNGTCIYDCDDSITTVITDGMANDTIVSGASTMNTDNMSAVDVDMVGPFYWRVRQSIELNVGFTIQTVSSLTINVGDCDN